ncbi:Cof-type HAD-IIB family hydrolase [Paenibacillus sp. LMG 31458]|uniref:Cof-type HAD-IIB family hydrolase n=1 Tax=Paenibacillus phytorum TaxID=2654977 RepID=A0ABX1XYF1_9BACL|nr:HAD family hydrolase [Paenibacillus phytorum]NOU73556.1 Cof-type HAD-IIB family hydrolase [Paenibacillus phytorum]
MSGKWIITDLDGTLLNSQQQVGEETIRRAEQFRSQGGRFTFATGRTLISTKPFIEQLNIVEPVILFNGAKIYDPVRGAYLEEYFLPQPYTELVLNLYSTTKAQYGLDLLVFVNEQIYVPEWSDEVERFQLKDKVIIQQKPYTEIYSEWKRINKIMLLGDVERVNQFQEYCIKVFADIGPSRLNSVVSEPGLLEVLPPGINKGSACLRLMEIADVKRETITTIGDGLNDLEMITSYHGIAMKNGHPELKSAASRVTERNNDEDALVEVMDMLDSLEVK